MTAAAFDWSAVQAEFPVNRHLIWLNNCGTTPTPGPVVQVMQRYLQAYAEKGVLSGQSEWGVHGACVAHLAGLLGATPDEVTLVHHTTEGLTFVSQGLTLAAGDRIVLLENEYPSNVYPWEHWQERGVHLDFVPPGATPEEFLHNFRAALRPTTRVVSLSAVHWCTGMPLPLGAVGDLCQAEGMQFVVDGSQGVGLVPLDVERMKIDYLAFSAWKWLLGPLGLGGLYVRRSRLDQLRFPLKGTGSVINDEQYLPYRAALKPTAARFVCSTPNFNDWIYFEASLAYLAQIGFARARMRIDQLATHLRHGLRGIGFRLVSDAFADQATGIVVAERPGVDSAHLVTVLAERQVVAAARLGRLRLAPHIYNSEAQLDRVVALLERC